MGEPGEPGQKGRQVSIPSTPHPGGLRSPRLRLHPRPFALAQGDPGIEGPIGFPGPKASCCGPCPGGGTRGDKPRAPWLQAGPAAGVRMCLAWPTAPTPAPRKGGASAFPVTSLVAPPHPSLTTTTPPPSPHLPVPPSSPRPAGSQHTHW